MAMTSDSMQARDPAHERRERLRYQVLRRLYRRTGAPGQIAAADMAIGNELAVSRESLFQAIFFLAHRGYLCYEGAGPRVSMTQMGIDYLSRHAGRRRSIRD